MLCYRYCELFMSVAVEYSIVYEYSTTCPSTFWGFPVWCSYREDCCEGACLSVLVHKSLRFSCIYSNDWKHQDLGRHIFTFSRFVVVQSPSHVWLFETPSAAARQASLSLTVSRSLPKFMSIASVMPSSYLILWCPLLLLSSIFPGVRDFVSESAVCFRWPKYWSFSFSISPSNEYSGLISLRIDWFDLLAVQGTLRSLLQHHSSKASVLRCSAFFTVQLSQLYVPNGRTIAFTIRTFVGGVMSLLFNTLSRFVIAFLPRSNCLLVSWLQSPSPVILKPKKRKSVTASAFSVSICHEIMGLDAMILVCWMLSFKPAFPLSSSTLTKRFFSSSLLFA